MANLAEVLASTRALLAEQGLDGWIVRWSNSRRTAGQCRYGLKTIVLSRPLMTIWTLDECDKTIRHEVAHALAPGDHHGAVWASKCRMLGIKPTRCWGTDPDDKREHAPMKFKGICPNGHESGMMVLPKRERSCARCSRRFNLAYLIIWTPNPDFGPVSAPRPTYVPTAAAAQTSTPTPSTPKAKANRCHAPMPGGKVCNRVQGHTRGHDAR